VVRLRNFREEGREEVRWIEAHLTGGSVESGARTENRTARRFGGTAQKNLYSADSAWRLLRFQYKYPGTPIRTMAMLQKASRGRWMIVFNIQAAPIRT
jgi:hypothetical protein